MDSKYWSQNFLTDELVVMPKEPTGEIIEAMVVAMTMGAGYQYPKKLVTAAYKAAVAVAGKA